jgi:RNA polymerase sigma-70 factor (ECF subfamily)
MQHDIICAPSREEELNLIDGLVRGDQAAWRRFHQQYGRLIFRCIRKVTQAFSSVVRGDDEQEIYSNLVVQLLSNDKRKLRAFDPDRGSRLGTWIGMLATHAAYDHLRSMRREVPYAPLCEAESTAAQTTCPFEQVESKEQSRMVRELVDRLSMKDRQFVRLYFDRGMSPEAVADAMHISVKTVYSKKHKICTRLEGIVVGAA